MLTHDGAGGFNVRCGPHTVQYSGDRPDRLAVTVGDYEFDLFLMSSADCVEGTDIGCGVQLRTIGEVAPCTWRTTFSCTSPIRLEKTIHLSINSGCIEYWYELRGQGHLTTLRFFEGVHSADRDVVSSATKHLHDKRCVQYRERSWASRGSFEHVSLSEPNCYGQWSIDARGSAEVSPHSDDSVRGGNFFLNPGLFRYGLS